MIDPIVTEEQLSKISGYKRSSDIELWCKNLGIGYTVGKEGRIGSTISALDSVTVKKQKTKPVGVVF